MYKVQTVYGLVKYKKWTYGSKHLYRVQKVYGCKVSNSSMGLHINRNLQGTDSIQI